MNIMLNGQAFSTYINEDPTSDSILGATMFLIFIHKVPDVTISEVVIYADDKTL